MADNEAILVKKQKTLAVLKQIYEDLVEFSSLVTKLGECECRIFMEKSLENGVIIIKIDSYYITETVLADEKYMDMVLNGSYRMR